MDETIETYDRKNNVKEAIFGANKVLKKQAQQRAEDLRNALTESTARVREKTIVVHNSVIDKTNTLLVSAFGLVAALAWNDAVQKWIASSPLLASSGPLVYALIVTVIAVVVTVLVSWASEKFKR